MALLWLEAWPSSIARSFLCWGSHSTSRLIGLHSPTPNRASMSSLAHGADENLRMSFSACSKNAVSFEGSPDGPTVRMSSST